MPQILFPEDIQDITKATGTTITLATSIITLGGQQYTYKGCKGNSIKISAEEGVGIIRRALIQETLKVIVYHHVDHSWTLTFLVFSPGILKGIDDVFWQFAANPFILRFYGGFQ